MKYLPLISLLLFIGGCTVSGDIEGKPELSAQNLCQKTVRDYAILRDEGPAEDYANLFTEDGTFTLGEATVKGRAALAARHEAANAAALWRHNMLDVRISETGGQVTGVSRFIIYTAPHPAPAKNPREIIGDYIDTFVLEDGYCAISSRQVRIVFDSQNR